MIFSKLWQITRLGDAIRQNRADSEIICVWTYEKVPRIICLDPKSNTYILDYYDNYYHALYLQVSNLLICSIVTMSTELFDLGYRALVFALTNLESGPQFA